jgi:hypothetical protein
MPRFLLVAPVAEFAGDGKDIGAGLRIPQHFDGILPALNLLFE